MTITDGFPYELFLDDWLKMVRKLMDESGQGPPNRCGDLEGA